MLGGDKTQEQGPSTKDRQFRVFISSTFLDMHTERDDIRSRSFRELREGLEQVRLEVLDMDLRCAVLLATHLLTA